MTREIEFRAWNAKKKEMFVGIYLGSGFDEDYHISTGWYLEDMEMMQYTGLKDKNGIKIFEGDICNIKPRGKQWDIGYVKYSVKYGQYVLMVKYSYYGEEKKEHVIFCHNGSSTQSRPYNMHSFGNGIEVIGNIYQNPELIK